MNRNYTSHILISIVVIGLLVSFVIPWYLNPKGKTSPPAVQTNGTSDFIGLEVPVVDTENSPTVSLSKNGPEWRPAKSTDTRTAVAFPLRAPTKIRSWNKPTNDLTYKVLEIATICDIYIAELEEPNGETRVMTDWDAQNFPVGTFVRATCDSKNMTWKFKVVPRESVNRNIEYYNTFYYNYP